jgi:hypothetical protein
MAGLPVHAGQLVVDVADPFQEVVERSVGDGLPHFLQAFGFEGDVQSGIGPGDAGAGLPLAEPGVQLVEEGSDLIEARLACWQETEPRMAADIRQHQRDGAQARRSDRQCTVLLVEPPVAIGVSPLLGHLVQAAVVALRHLITCNVEQALVFLQEPQADEVLQRLARGGGAANRESEDEQVLKQAEVGRDHGHRGEECLLLLGDGAKLAEEVCSLDGTLIRVPDTPANRQAFGSVGTSDDSTPFPMVRALPMNDVSTRSLLGMTHGPSGGGAGKAAGEQKLLDQAMEQYPHLFTKDRLWLMDRNFPGTARLARLFVRTHVLIRLKSDIPLRRVSPILADGSYRADLSGDGLTIRVRVIEYFAEVAGQDVPEMFCLVTDLTDIAAYPAPQLAGLCRRRWDGPETALREAKASLDGAGPGTGPMLRSQAPALVRQELAAWAAATEMTRGVARDAAAAALPARKGRRAGQPVRPREISHARTRRAVTTAIRAGRACYQDLTREIAKYRTIVDRNRHRARKSKSPSSSGRATARDTRTRIAPAVITMANTTAPA